MVSNEQMIKKYKKINNSNNNINKKEINLRFPQNYLEFFFFKPGFLKFDKLSLGGGWIYL